MHLRSPTLLLALGLLAVVLGLHHQLLQGGLLGAEQSDTIRGIWGLDHQARALPLPFWSDRVGFPEGVKLLILPFASSLLAAPLVWLFGAGTAWNLWMLALLWASGFTTGLFARQLTGRPASGMLAGCMVIGSPMLWLALTDGTPENVAFWALPAFLLALWRALADGGWRWGLLAGLLATVTAADSPYHAVFALMLAPICLLALRRPADDSRPQALGAMLGTCALGAGLLLFLYLGLPLDEAPESSRVGNAVQMRAWMQWEEGRIQRPWEWTLVPNFIPAWTLVGCLALALISPMRAAPWIMMAAAMLMLSLGPGQENPSILGRVFGSWAVAPLQAWAGLLDAHPPPVVRFLRRFLVPAAFCLGIAAELGLARWRRLSWLSAPLGLLVVLLAAQKTGYANHLPRLQPPHLASCDFVADHHHDGAILVLPRVRAAHRLEQRDELPVFARLGASVQSAAELYVQVRCERPAMNMPVGMLTMVPRLGRAEETSILLRDLDDLTLPQTVGRSIPPSALQDPQRTRATVAWLVDQGLSFVVVDEEMYGPEGLGLLREHFFVERLQEERSFDDGAGVTVFVLGPSPAPL